MSEELHPGLHPDPDALNAFMEGVLPEHERAGCLAHLAECAQCREVVFLAGQAAEIAVGKTPFWRKVFRPMPVLAVACAAIFVVFSFQLFRMIRSAERRPQVTASAKPPVETAPGTKADQEKQKPQLAQRRRELPPTAAVAPPPPQAVAGVDAIQALPATPPPIVPGPPPAPAAHVPGAGVIGMVTDPAGAVIPKAQIELKNEGTGATYSSTSDGTGQFSIAGLAPGRYDFSVTSMGFKKFVRPGVNVQPQELARLDSTLEVGAASDTVTVNAEAPLLKTESGELSHRLDYTSASELPLFSSTRANARAMINASPTYRLPDQSTPVSAAAKDKLVVAIDAAGSLFFSDNQGKGWTHIKGQWKGKAVRVVVSANAAFELTTDPAATWVSTDGRHWSAVRK